MLSRLTRGLRRRWARVLAVVYLCLVLTPGLAFAFGDGVAARCALMDVHQAAMAQVQSPAHDGEAAGAAHAHHHHGGAQAVSDAGSVVSFSPVSQIPVQDAPSHHSGKADKMCCGLACLSALPAAFAAVLPLEFVASAQMSLPVQALVALTPARLYKPPIA